MGEGGRGGEIGDGLTAPTCLLLAVTLELDASAMY